MSGILETIAINDNYRVAVTYDDISDCPLAWNDEINAHTIRVDRGILNMKELGVYDEESYALDTLIDTLDYYGNGDPEDMDTAILKHLKRKGYAARIAEVGGRDGWHFAVFYARRWRRKRMARGKHSHVRAMARRGSIHTDTRTPDNMD